MTKFSKKIAEYINYYVYRHKVFEKSWFPITSLILATQEAQQ